MLHSSYLGRALACHSDDTWQTHNSMQTCLQPEALVFRLGEDGRGRSREKLTRLRIRQNTA
jgi:hypothetical protein